MEERKFKDIICVINTDTGEDMSLATPWMTNATYMELTTKASRDISMIVLKVLKWEHYKVETNRIWWKE